MTRRTPSGAEPNAVVTDFKVAVASGREAVAVSARSYEPPQRTRAALVLAPGAGAGHDHPFMVSFGQGLAARGLHLVTFNFPYIERGRRAPDANGTLEACWESVLGAVRGRVGAPLPLFAGGKSMGGRIASQVAARGGASADLVAGLVFLGYPLHPPGRPEQERSAHWGRIRVPALFIQGTRDPFGSPEELAASLPRYASEARRLVIEGGDHSFRVPARGGRSQQDVHAQIQDAIAAWIDERS